MHAHKAPDQWSFDSINCYNCLCKPLILDSNWLAEHAYTWTREQKKNFLSTISHTSSGCVQVCGIVEDLMKMCMSSNNPAMAAEKKQQQTSRSLQYATKMSEALQHKGLIWLIPSASKNLAHFPFRRCNILRANLHICPH